MNMQAFFPEHLANNPQYKVLLDTMSIEMDVIAAYIKDFVDIFDPDYSPERFLEILSNDLGYDFTKDHSTLSQREITKRLFEAYKKRGTEVDVNKTLVYGPDGNYFRGDLTYYEGPLEGQEVHLYYPIDHIFIYSKSSLSGSDKIQSDVYRAGTIIVQIEEWDSLILDKLLDTLPAGIRFIIEKLIHLLGENGEIVSFKEYRNETSYTLQFDISCMNKGNCFILNETPLCSLIPLSGEKVLYLGMEVQKELAASFIKPDVLKKTSGNLWSFYPEELYSSQSNKKIDYNYDYLFNYFPNFISEAIAAGVLNLLVENNYALFNDRPWVNLKVNELIHDINYLIYGVGNFCMRKGLFKLSDNFVFNAQHPVSGIRVGYTITDILVDSVQPYDFLYNVSEVEDLIVEGCSIPNYCPSFESFLLN